MTCFSAKSFLILTLFISILLISCKGKKQNSDLIEPETGLPEQVYPLQILRNLEKNGFITRFMSKIIEQKTKIIKCEI